MNVKWRMALVALLAGILVAGTGCGGINASGGVSPMMFLLPGVGQTKPAGEAPIPEVTATNPVLVAQAH